MSVTLPDAGRPMGGRITAARGTGKSRLLGRRIVVGDFDRKIPQVVFDPTGDTIDNFLDVLMRRPLTSETKAAAERIVYVDVGGGTGFVTPLPVYHRGDGEELDLVAARPIDVWRRIDPALGHAPIMGLNPVKTTGSYVGMLLSALGWRMTEAEAILRDPNRFRERFAAVSQDDDRLQEAAKWVLALPKPTTSDWHRQCDSFLNKIREITLNDAARATYCADVSGIDWDEIEQEGKTVLCDFRHLGDNDELLSFGLVWWFRAVLGHIKRRGPTRDHPFSIVVDELAHFLSGDRDQQDLIAGDFEELVVVRSRSHGVWLFVSHQELNQLSKRMGQVMMSLGTQIFSSTSDLEGGAEVWATRFDRYNPNDVKSWRLIDRRFEPGSIYTIQEQRRLAAQEKYLQLPPFTFWAAVSSREGELGQELQPLTITTEDGFVDRERCMIARERLAARSGQPTGDVLASIKSRLMPKPLSGSPPAEERLDDDPRPPGMPPRRKRNS